jgi:hypothetical protein
MPRSFKMVVSSSSRILLAERVEGRYVVDAGAVVDGVVGMSFMGSTLATAPSENLPRHEHAPVRFVERQTGAEARHR